MIRRRIWNKRGKASVTVEAAVALWITIMVLVMVLLMFPFLEKQIASYQVMYQVAQDAQCASVFSEEAALGVLLGDSYSAWKKRSSDSDILFYGIPKNEGYQYRATFSKTFPFLPGLDKKLCATQHLYIKNWNGYNRAQEYLEYVYITETGYAYHRTAACFHLKLSIQQVMYEQLDRYRNEYGGKYYPCASCGRRVRGGEVYITTDGTRYHGNKDCRSLLRTIQKVSLEEAKVDHTPCKDCY